MLLVNKLEFSFSASGYGCLKACVNGVLFGNIPDMRDHGVFQHLEHMPEPMVPGHITKSPTVFCCQ